MRRGCWGTKIIIVETFARFNTLSAFARGAGRMAHHKVVQSAALTEFWPDAAVFDPLRTLNTPRPEKKPLLFVTVGATLPFDSMVQAVAQLKAAGAIPERVLVQTGVGGVTPDGVEAVETMPFEEILETLQNADIVVCHGGTGSLVTALRAGCRVVAMPRSAERGEHYDNHQTQITQAFAARGLIAVAHSPEELESALATVRSRPSIPATTDPTALVDHLNSLIAGFRLARANPRDQGAPERRLLRVTAPYVSGIQSSGEFE